MKVLSFQLFLENEEIDSDLISRINKILNCRLAKYDGDRRPDEEVWESELFGLEIELACSSEWNETILTGSSEKICHYMPEEEEREFTDISEEVLNLFRIFFPGKKWKRVIQTTNHSYNIIPKPIRGETRCPATAAIKK